MARPPLSQWTQGCVTLLGDAAHQALLRYKAARRDRARQILEKSTENGRRFHNQALADAVGATAYVDSEWSPAKVKQRYEWLFRYRVDETPV